MELRGTWIRFSKAVYQSGYLRSNVFPWLALRKHLTHIPFLPFSGCFDYTQCPSENRGILKWTSVMLDTVHCSKYSRLCFVLKAFRGLAIVSPSRDWYRQFLSVFYACVKQIMTSSHVVPARLPSWNNANPTGWFCAKIRLWDLK